ncbi:WXG100 family type VII secretion target [Kineothrix alysoides]|uniref:WXG100 family type VII secretion target n=1 Tax=Kineothrix alysoides TaxID=1469948 RepID=A0A4R1R164_9FIRM|nr:WXG100 family type VII secretion target [Kineothrix alysoides]TCL59039.1 WXG100 family type VII secretion target [Kineothrix alysoides]
MATGNESKIDTKLFASTADTIANAAKELSRLFGDWNKTMNSLRGSWQGDVSDDIKNTVEQVQKSSADLGTALGGYSGTLKEIAGIYDKTEKNTQETGKSLKFERTMR